MGDRLKGKGEGPLADAGRRAIRRWEARTTGGECGGECFEKVCELAGLSPAEVALAGERAEERNA